MAGRLFLVCTIHVGMLLEKRVAEKITTVSAEKATNIGFNSVHTYAFTVHRAVDLLRDG